MVKTWRRSLTTCLSVACISIFSFTEPTSAQKVLTREQVLQDAKVTEEILKKYHPNLNAHRTQAQIEAIWDEAKARLPDSPNVLDAATLIQQMLAAVCDEHTGITSDQKWLSDQAQVEGLFPIGLVLLDDKLYLDDAMFNLRLREVININGRESREIIKLIRSIVSEDGCQNSNVLFTRHRNSQVLLSAILTNYFGNTSEFKIRYREKATGDTNTLGLRQVNMAEVERRAKYRGLDGRATPLKSVGIKARDRDWGITVENPMQAMVRSDDRKSIYYVYVPSFTGGRAQADFFDRQIRDLVRANPDHVIVDLTDNPGGSFNNAQRFLSYFLTTSSRPWTVTRSRIDRNISEKNFKWRGKQRRKQVSGRLEKFRNGQRRGNQFQLDVTSRSFGNNSYKGDLTVLVNPRTSSAATMVATILKRKAGAKIVGAVSDVSMETSCNSAPGEHLLPNSGAPIAVPIVCGDRHPEAKSKGSLLQLDVPVDITTHNSSMTNVLILRAAIDSLPINRAVARVNSRQPTAAPVEPTTTKKVDFEITEKTIPLTLAANPHNRNVGLIGIGMLDVSGFGVNVPEIEREIVPLVTDVLRGSPAEKNGIQVGDILLSIDDQNPNGMFEVMDFMKDRRPNEKVELRILRLSKSEKELVEILKNRIAQADDTAVTAFVLGSLYVTGSFGSPNRREGVLLLNSAADAGYAKAAVVLGDLHSGHEFYWFSRGSRTAVAKNTDRAMVYYSRAAIRGESRAMFRLAQLFGEQGDGHSDPELAAWYLLQSYRNKNRSAQDSLLETPYIWTKDARIALKRFLHEAGVYDGDFDGEIDAEVREALKRMTNENVALPELPVGARG
ncbi:MAG: S41 family peptidase [Pseudomonadota bacterium]